MRRVAAAYAAVKTKGGGNRTGAREIGLVRRKSSRSLFIAIDLSCIQDVLSYMTTSSHIIFIISVFVRYIILCTFLKRRHRGRAAEVLYISS